MKIQEHVLGYISQGLPQQICTHVNEDADNEDADNHKTMQFDGKLYGIRGFHGDVYFEYEFDNLEDAIACYQAIEI